MERKTERTKPPSPIVEYEELVRFSTFVSSDDRMHVHLGIYQKVEHYTHKDPERPDPPFLGLEVGMDDAIIRFEGAHLQDFQTFMEILLSLERQVEIDQSLRAATREHRERERAEAAEKQRAIDDHWNRLKTASKPKNKSGGGLGSFKKPGKSREKWEEEQRQKKLTREKAEAEAAAGQPAITVTQEASKDTLVSLNPEVQPENIVMTAAVDPAVELAQLEKDLAALEEEKKAG